MRTEKEIGDKVKELIDKEIRKKSEEYLTRGYKNCIFNFKCRVKNNGSVGFCKNKSVVESIESPVFVCSDDETAKNCNHYICRNTKESLMNEFKEEISSPSVCGQKYPKLAVLLWVLKEGQIISSENKKCEFFIFKIIKDFLTYLKIIS